MVELDVLEIERFSGREQESFRVRPGDGETLELKLIEVTSLGERDPGRRKVRRRPFSLLFSGPPEPILQQRIWRVEHGELGTFDLFLVPIDQDDRRTQYEAVFT